MPIEPRSKAAPDSTVSVASEITPPTTGTAPDTASFAVFQRHPVHAARNARPLSARYAVNSVKMSLSAPEVRLLMPSARPRSMPLPAAASTAVIARYAHAAGTSRAYRPAGSQGRTPPSSPPAAPWRSPALPPAAQRSWPAPAAACPKTRRSAPACRGRATARP